MADMAKAIPKGEKDCALCGTCKCEKCTGRVSPKGFIKFLHRNPCASWAPMIPFEQWIESHRKECHHPEVH